VRWEDRVNNDVKPLEGKKPENPCHKKTNLAATDE
jgi:hypothetical protein